MPDNNQKFLKKDIVYILQLNSQIQYDDKYNVQKAHDMALRKQLFKTVLGQKYLMRLEQVISGTDTSNKCTLCKNELDNPSLVCNSCMVKYKLTPSNRGTSENPASARNAAPAGVSESSENDTPSDVSVPAKSDTSAGVSAPADVSASTRSDASAGLSSSTGNNTPATVPASTENSPTDTFSASTARDVTTIAYSLTETPPPAEAQPSANLKLRDLFSDVFKKHTRSESEEIFITGTSKATSHEDATSAPLPKPWLFSRVLVTLLASFAFLYVCAAQSHNSNVVPGLMFMGASALPLSVLIFMFEINVSRDISIFEVMKMLFLGGMTSLVLTLFLFEAFPIGQLNYTEAIIVGLIEALGRLLVIVLFTRLLNPRYILSGMLIGAATGAGFAISETIMYTFRFYLLSGGSINYLSDILMLRLWSALGSHVAWAAITGAGLVMAKGDKPFNFKLFTDMNFLKYFFIPIILHTIWDCPFMDSGSIVYMKLTVLIVIAWAVIFTQVDKGLKQTGY